MIGRRITIEGTPGRYGLKIDDEILPVEAVDLHVDATSVARLTITPAVWDTTAHIEGDAELSEEATKVIRALGWIDTSKITGFVIDGMPGIVHPHDVKILSE